MKFIHPIGTEGCRHPRPAADRDGGHGIGRPLAALLLAAAFPFSSANAQETPAPGSLPAAEEAPAPALGPSMTGPLHLNTDPLDVDVGALGKVYISGVISGIGLAQNNHFPGDKDTRFDLSNGQLIAQSVSGPIQFYVQAGGYSIASLGTPYFKAANYVADTYGIVPVAYVKIVPSSNFNVQVGKLFTLQGAENAFTFQNFNIQRGLLFNQTSTVNRGVQANFSSGKFSASFSLNDGFYSNKYNWLSGVVSYAVSSKDSVTLGASANVGSTSKSTFATPTVLNNGQLYFLSWTHNDGPWTLQAYGQVGHVPKDDSLGIGHSASTYGAAVLGKYSFNDQFSLAARAEYIDSSGSVANGAPSLIYGPGSGAWSLTVTPTWQKGIFFARAEGSYVKAHDVVDGSGLGRDFDKSSQLRGLVEAGIIF
ncbi:MAG TPA: outer membrane beta-barrel protein [Sphingomicrobium sp.]|nr:outer membrane beta-barrel protein [Sphingomicrobium sp.]